MNIRTKISMSEAQKAAEVSAFARRLAVQGFWRRITASASVRQAWMSAIY
jgi:hypothetical protein